MLLAVCAVTLSACTQTAPVQTPAPTATAQVPGEPAKPAASKDPAPKPEVPPEAPVVAQANDAKQLSAQQRQKIEQAVLRALESPAIVEIGDAPTKGAKDAPLTLVEFSDFQCPYCAYARNAFVKPLLDNYPGKMRLVYKHFPLTQIHQFSFDASKAAWAAQQQGKFFEYHDLLFDRQKDLGEVAFVKIAKDLKLDLVKFNKDRTSPQAEASIKANMAQGSALNLKGTPTFVLNGIVIEAGTPLEVIDTIIEVLKTKKGLNV